jgi:cytochrome c oxidase subunit 1
MLMFAFGGISGLINASYNVNLVVHNTAWVPGHFHLTVGTAVTLTYMGISYWLVPYLRGRELWNRQLALVQAWLWFVGMGIFSHSMHRLGLMGMPRRTKIGSATYLGLQPN